MRAGAAAVLSQVGLSVDPDTQVRQLIVAEKQLVEIAKALARKARLLIMDEPTATLTPGETERLFALIAQLKADGVTIVYISHKLDEVERITDEVIVMRDGRFVARDATANLTRQQMANLMVGRELSDLFPPKPRRPARHRAPAAGAAAERAGLGRGRRASRCAPARSSASPASSAPAAPSCSKACWACAAPRRAHRDRRPRGCASAARARPPTTASPT